MTQDPLDQHEELIADELCEYQSQLDHGKPVDRTSIPTKLIPPEVAPALDELRHCLDLLNQARSQANTEPFTVPLDAKPSSARSKQRYPEGHERNSTILQTPEGSSRWVAAAPPISMEVFPLPSHIGGFKILERVGIGGFGIVFRAVDPVVGREVAIKIPRPELLNSPDLIERFRREATAAAQLDHPNIVPVFESDVYGITPYIVTPFIPGPTLGQWRAKQSEIPPRIAAEIIRQLAEGAAHAHEHGVLHRDLKPSNILLAPREKAGRTPGTQIVKASIPPDQPHDSFDEQISLEQENTENSKRTSVSGDVLSFIPKLADFGMAKCDTLQNRNTQTGTIIGTTGYMSPEQAEGRSRDITARSDIYGLGAVLYELLTGQPPFQGENDLQTLHNMMQNAPLSILENRHQFPKDLEVICLKCLERNPAKRYSSATDLANDLKRFLNGEPIEARAISHVSRFGKWCCRHPLRASFIGSAALGLIGLIVISLWYNSRLTSLLEIADREQRAARQSALESKRRAYVSDMRTARSDWTQTNVTQVLKLLDRYRPRDGEQDVRDFAWWSLWNEYNETSRVLGTHGEQATAVAMNRTGNLAASGGSDSIIRLWNLPSGKLVGELHGHESKNIESLDFSPDGERLVSAGEDGTIRIWDVKGRIERSVRREHQSLVSQAIYSPNGDIIASGGGDNMIRLWNGETGEPVGTIPGHSKRVRCLAFHPTEPTLATGSLDGTVRIWNLKDQSPDQRFAEGIVWESREWPRALVFDNEGHRLVVGTVGSNIVQISSQAPNYGAEIRRELLSSIRGFNWPRGGTLAIALTSSVIEVADPAGLEFPREQLKGHLDEVVSVAGTVDGTCLISASKDGAVRYWPDFRRRHMIKLSPPDYVKPDDEVPLYSLHWRGPYMAVNFSHTEISVFRMPERRYAHSIPIARGDRFVMTPSGSQILVCQGDRSIKCLRVIDGETLWSLPLPPDESPKTSKTRNFCVIDKAENYAVITRGTEMIVVSLRDRSIVRHLRLPVTETNHVNVAFRAKFLEKSERPLIAISCGFDGDIRFWNVLDGTVVQQQSSSAISNYAVAVSDDQSWIAIAGTDGKVRIWSMHDLAEAQIISSTNTQMEFLSGSTILVHNRGLNFWSVLNESELMALPEPSLGQFAVSPDGNQVAIIQPDGIRIIDGRPKQDKSNTLQRTGHSESPKP